MFRWTPLFLAGALCAQQPLILELPSVERNPHTTPGDIAQGAKLFASRCAGCHGPGGEGGKGANLAVPVLANGDSDLGLYRVIRYGINETEMPATLLAPREVWQVMAFVRSLGKVDRAASSGDAARGKALMHGKAGCLGCHAVGVEGGRLGPSLSDIGARRGAAHLRRKVLDPGADIPDQFRMVELASRGQKVAGVRLNEDPWSIQVLDTAGMPRSFWKNDVTGLKVEKRTPMPSYQGRLSASEVDDVVAYMATLRGDR